MAKKKRPWRENKCVFARLWADGDPLVGQFAVPAACQCFIVYCVQTQHVVLPSSSFLFLCLGSIFLWSSGRERRKREREREREVTRARRTESRVKHRAHFSSFTFSFSLSYFILFYFSFFFLRARIFAAVQHLIRFLLNCI